MYLQLTVWESERFHVKYVHAYRYISTHKENNNKKYNKSPLVVLVKGRRKNIYAIHSFFLFFLKMLLWLFWNFIQYIWIIFFPFLYLFPDPPLLLYPPNFMCSLFNKTKQNPKEKRVHICTLHPTHIPPPAGAAGAATRTTTKKNQIKNQAGKNPLTLVTLVHSSFPGVLAISSVTPLKKTDFPLSRSYQWQVPTWLGMGLCVYHSSSILAFFSDLSLCESFLGLLSQFLSSQVH